LFFENYVAIEGRLNHKLNMQIRFTQLEII
jgi:hypothetical protein